MERSSARPHALAPPLKWAGGKRWQVPHLQAVWAAHADRRLVEPFCGGLAVALGLAPRRALLNDANPHLVNFYRWLKRGLVLDLPMANERALFYRYRSRFNRLLSSGGTRSRESAGLFYYLNRTGYNGLCRFNQRGEFNVPFGRYATVRYIRDFSPYRDALAGWQFSTVDVARLRLEPDDFVYADPPYDVEFTQYARHAFTWRDQERTAELLARHPGPVVLVNQATERIEHLYERFGFTLKFLQAPRRISCTGDRQPAREIMATRNINPCNVEL
jgi:DNA adenine methylase